MLVDRRPRDDPSLVVPRLERPAAEAGLPDGGRDRDLDGDGRARTPSSPASSSDARGRASATRVSDRLWSMHLLRLQAALPGTRSISATIALRPSSG